MYFSPSRSSSFSRLPSSSVFFLGVDAYVHLELIAPFSFLCFSLRRFFFEWSFFSTLLFVPPSRLVFQSLCLLLAFGSPFLTFFFHIAELTVFSVSPCLFLLFMNLLSQVFELLFEVVSSYLFSDFFFGFFPSFSSFTLFPNFDVCHASLWVGLCYYPVSFFSSLRITKLLYFPSGDLFIFPNVGLGFPLSPFFLFIFFSLRELLSF